MTKNHNYYLDLAFQLAEQNLGKTKLNPSVGSIVVKNNTMISSGVTSLNGRPHSEYNALSKIKNCRLAEPGEFTKLAFLNGKINLLKAESIGDLISAETEIQRQQALKIMLGKHSEKYNCLLYTSPSPRDRG